MLREIKLYGELADRYGKDWLLDVDSPSEAIRALSANNPKFRSFLASSEERGVGYTVMVGKTYIQKQEEIYDPSGKQEIKFIPVMLGAKKDGLKAILIGAALIIAAPYAAAAITAMGTAAGPMAYLGTTTSGIAGLASTAMIQVGWGLVRGGIAQALATTPDEVQDASNYGFAGAANTVKQGVAVPICYGQLMIGGATISSGITNENYSP